LHHGWLFPFSPGIAPVPTLAEAFSVALRHHQAGRLELARGLYQQILNADPNHADCHHLLGLIAYQNGRFDQAIVSIRHAITLKPSAPAYYSNFGLALEASGRIDDAVASYLHALSLQPDLAEIHCNLANALLKLTKFHEAATHYRHSLHLKQDYAEAHFGLGLALDKLAQMDEAVAQYRQALRVDPDHAEAHKCLANALLSQGKFEDALAHFQHAVRCRPASAQALCDLGNAQFSLGDLDEACRCYREALRLQPDFAEACNDLAGVLSRQEKHEEAASWYRKAMALKPVFPEAVYNLGNSLERQGKFREALRCYDELLRLLPNATGDLVGKAHWIRSLLWLLLGDFDKGWPEYEWRWARPGIAPRTFRQPVWDGSDLRGRRIFLYAEQGLGDTLQFIRFVPHVKERGAEVIVECQPSLVPLLAHARRIDHLLPVGDPLPAHDLQAALLSLPRIFGTSLDSIPTPIPYLHANPKLTDHWRKQATSGVRSPKSEVQNPTSSDIGHRTSDFGRILNVGIAWQGSPSFSRDRQRSIPLSCFGPLAKLQGIQLISLQKGPGTEQLSAVSCQLSEGRQTSFQVIDLGARLDERNGPFMDTAALMTNLDLVISSDTAIPHLAGALGVPVWVALSHIPDWRWMLERSDSPWYPTMRLFRQAKSGRWEEVFEQMAAELQPVVANR
jgi:tetratricopeptide (TPR) repeat protein